MGIESIGNYGGLHGNYKTRYIPSVDVETVKSQDAQKPEEQAQMQPEQIGHFRNDNTDDGIKAQAQRSRITNLEEISLTFNKAEDFSRIGSEVDPAHLDMEKAISDMRKDQVLEQYQYFVGSSQNMLTENNDGVVIQK